MVKMKSTEMGKDDDTAVTAKYNEGGEYRIGPDLLKAFERKGCVSIIGESKKSTPKKEEKATANEEKDEAPKVDEDKKDDSEFGPVKKKASKKKKKG